MDVVLILEEFINFVRLVLPPNFLDFATLFDRRSVYGQILLCVIKSNQQPLTFQGNVSIILTNEKSSVNRQYQAGC